MKKPNTSLRLILPLTALLLASSSVVRAQFYFTTNNGAITILRCATCVRDATIPDWTNGYPVTSLADLAFNSCLTLTNISIGTNLISLGGHVSSCCWDLKTITVNSNNAAYSSVAGVLFNKSQTTLLECPPAKDGNYTIPSSVTNIGKEAFGGCGLTNVTIPNSVIKLGDRAFGGCHVLGSVAIPSSVTSIGQGAFEYCVSLTNLTIGAGVTSIGGNIVYESHRLTAITVEANNPAYSSVDGVLFNKSLTTLLACPNGKTGTYDVPNGVASIGNSAFLVCRGLENINLPHSITSIDNYAFDYCTSLTSVTIPDQVTAVANGAFEGCHGLTNVTIPNGVTSIGRSAFCGCDSLSSVTIPDSVITIGDGAFYACTSLISVTIPDSVTTLEAAFIDCTRLSSVTLPNSIVQISDELFYWCSSLTNVTIPDSVISIGHWAFRECPSLATVTIGSNVTSIGDYALYGCPSLTGVYFQGNAPSLGAAVFDGDDKATVYYLPGTTGWGTTLGDHPTMPWTPRVDGSSVAFGMGTNGFAFNINWASGTVVVVEVCTNLANPVWSPLQTNTLESGSSYFNDPAWTNHPNRFYHLRSP